jgi:hypothetical protein
VKVFIINRLYCVRNFLSTLVQYLVYNSINLFIINPMHILFCPNSLNCIKYDFVRISKIIPRCSKSFTGYMQIHNTSLFPNVISRLVSTSLLRVTFRSFKRTLFLNTMYIMENFIKDLGKSYVLISGSKMSPLLTST